MKSFLIRFSKLIFGLFLYALGIVISMSANIGYAPWDVFHVGLAKTLGISIGLASIVTGIAIGLIAYLLGEKLGLGTLLNMILIGVFIDIIMATNLIQVASNPLLGGLMMLAGLFVIALASYFYIGAAFGAGPRDSLMVVLTRKTKLPIGLCRGIIELLAVLVGWQLGGMLGIGTVFSAGAIGLCVQTTFKWLKFDASAVKHETINQTIKGLSRAS